MTPFDMLLHLRQQQQHHHHQLPRTTTCRVASLHSTVLAAAYDNVTSRNVCGGHQTRLSHGKSPSTPLTEIVCHAPLTHQQQAPPILLVSTCIPRNPRGWRQGSTHGSTHSSTHEYLNGRRAIPFARSSGSPAERVCTFL